MTFQGFVAYILAFVQMLGVMFGIIPVANNPIDYGGDEYVEKVIEEYMTLVDEGESDYRIIISQNATEPEKNAANALQKYLKQISGCELTVADDTSRVWSREILVGKTNREAISEVEIDRRALGEDGFTLLVDDEKLFICGGGNRGTLYGVYSLLEEQLGCRWYSPELTVIPESKTVRIDAKLNDAQKPAFSYRHTDWRSSRNAEWAAANKTNGTLPKEMGGSVTYAAFCHTMATLVPDSLYAEHPEYFAYRIDASERLDPTVAEQHSQRCLSNPDVLTVTIENTREILQAKPDAQIMSITQNDNQLYCECDRCNAVSEQYGGQGGLNLWFVNQVARALKNDFPNILFDTFAYHYTRTPPKNIVAEDNVCIRFCTIENCFCHPIRECGHQRQDEDFFDRAKEVEPRIANEMKEWGKLCKRLYVWDYTANFRHYLQLFPNFHVMADNLQFFLENNAEGVFEEGLGGGEVDYEFGAMKAYILAKLMWNPYQNVEHMMDEFMDAYYGEASAPYVKQYINFITNKITNCTHLYIQNWHYENGYFTYPEIIKMDIMWKKAKDNAGTEEQLTRIRRTELVHRYYKMAMFTGEFALINPLRFRIENEKLYNDVIELGITSLDINVNLLAEEHDFWKRTFDQ